MTRPNDWTEIISADAVEQASADLSEVLTEVERDSDTIYGEDEEEENDLDEIYGDVDDDDSVEGEELDEDDSEVVAAVEDAIPFPSEIDADLSFDEAMAGADLDDLPARASADDWTEVLGDDAGDEDVSESDQVAFEQFGELFGRSAAFRDYAAKLVAASRPMVAAPRVPLKKARDWQLDFGPASMPAGEVTTITVRPQCLFRGEKIMANDTANPAGTGTRIVSVTVGQKIQRPAGGARGSLTRFFQANALANGVLFDTAQPWCDVAVTVSFVSACTFDMSVFGRAVVDR